MERLGVAWECGFHRGMQDGRALTSTNDNGTGARDAEVLSWSDRDGSCGEYYALYEDCNEDAIVACEALRGGA
jgi:hypothetical protein